MNTDEADDILRDEFQLLWDEVDALWERSMNLSGWHAYVSADYGAVLDTLISLRGQAVTFLEWGSGLGVATIMASRLGFEAFGIENEPELIDHAEEFAGRYGPHAAFAQGNFIPNEFEWNPRKGHIEDRTTLDSFAAYEALDMRLSDFDVVYAYPWPEEHTLYRNVMRELGGANAVFITFDVREGIEMHRCGRNES